MRKETPKKTIKEPVAAPKPQDDALAKVAIDAAREAQKSAENAAKIAQSMIDSMSDGALVKEIAKLIEAQNKLIAIQGRPPQAIRVIPKGNRGNGMAAEYDIIPLQKKTH